MFSLGKSSSSGSGKTANRELQKLKRQDLLELLVEQMREGEQQQRLITELQHKNSDLDSMVERLKDKLDIGKLARLYREGRIPVMLAVFVEPGDKGDGMPIYGGGFVEPGSNRGTEYDSVDDRFSRFLIEELLPVVAADYNLSPIPEDHGICGASSAAQAAFSAAWHRPDMFRKIISHIGSFTAIRGGDCNPDRIRKNPPKPIRIFLQDGEHDLNIIYGDWVLANKTMVSALEYRGYDYKYVLGQGGHNIEHGGAILPETLEWLWR